VTVVMFGAWDVLDHVENGTDIRFGTPAWTQLVAGAVGAALDAAGSGSRPVAVMNVPCYASPPAGGPDASVRDDPARSAALDAIISAAAAPRPSVHILDVGSVLCPGGTFRDQLDGVELRPDGVHLTAQSSSLLWRTWLGPQLDAMLG
jgi:hypothetical protein